MRFILLTEASRLYGLSRQTIRNWIDNGVIPAQKINGTFYVDGDTFEALSEKMRDVEAFSKNLDELKAEYAREAEEYRDMRERMHDEHNVGRYLSICVNSGIRTHFFDNVVRSMGVSGILKEKEAEILSSVLRGEDMADVAMVYHTSREYIRQIAEKAIRKSRDVIIRKSRDVIIAQTQDKDKEIDELKAEIAVLKKMVYREAIRATEDGLTDTEKKLARMDKVELMTLLSRPLKDEEFTVRTQNALKYYTFDGVHMGVKTLGDLCRVSRDKMIRQRNVGMKTVIELTDYLTANGLTWDMDIDRILELA